MSTWLNRIVLPMPYYCLCLNDKQFAKALRHLSIPKADWPAFVTPGRDACAHFFTQGSATSCIVCLNEGQHSAEQIYALLVHEAVHIWQEMELILGESGKEVEAYSIQGIAQQLFLAYKDLKDK